MLKRLELVGFKSFGQKTVLDFPKGITVIVGPNGSGKSNIIDALRWLLGEREAKNLRGAKAENLIFSGTSGKTRLGMAQAAVYFDNSSGVFPVDFNDVAISRKIYRDGTSECQINQAQVRLKDVVDLFAQSKMGTKGFSIINQGDSDLFIKASSQERREMMEEVLGLRQYQIKRHDAELKLKNTAVNLEKVGATLEELLPRLRLLRRQSNKWEKRVVFAEELSDLENKYFASKVKDLEENAQAIDPKIKEIDQKLNQKKQELGKLEEEVKKIESGKLAQLSGNQSNQRRFDLQRKLGGLEAQLELLSANAVQSNSGISYSQLANLVKAVQKEIDSICEAKDFARVQQLLQNLRKKINETLNPAQKHENTKTRKQTIVDEIENAQKELVVIENEEKQNLHYFENFNNVFRTAFEAVSKKRDEIQRLKDAKNNLLFEKDRWNYRWQDLEEKIKQAGRQPQEFSNVQLAVAKDFDHGWADSRMLRLRNELALIGEIDKELVKEAAEVEERHNFLQSQTADLGKASVDLEKLIGDLGQRIHHDFNKDLQLVNKEFDKHFKSMFGEGKARLIKSDESIDIEVSIPSKGIKSLEALSGGEKSLVSIAALFALISISPPPFLVFDEIDAALDEKNSRRFAEMLKNFSSKTQFAIVTHNRAVMEAGDVLYGVSMGKDGVSKILSLKLTA